MEVFRSDRYSRRAFARHGVTLEARIDCNIALYVPAGTTLDCNFSRFSLDS